MDQFVLSRARVPRILYNTTVNIRYLCSKTRVVYASQTSDGVRALLKILKLSHHTICVSRTRRCITTTRTRRNTSFRVRRENIQASHVISRIASADIDMWWRSRRRQRDGDRQDSRLSIDIIQFDNSSRRCPKLLTCNA